MATVRNTFVSGKQNLDVDERLLPKGTYRKGQNIRIANSNGSDVGAIEKSLSNQQITSLDLGENIHTIGGTTNEFNEKLYWLVKSDLGSYIIEHNFKTSQTEFVLKDTRAENVLSLSENHLVTGIAIIIDTDNGKTYLTYTDNNTQPKLINIEREKKNYLDNGENNFEEEDILLIKKPPVNSPKILLKKNNSLEENNIKDRFLRFYSRFKYLDGEYSPLSPASEIAFKGKDFFYDFATSTNESMVNAFNEVDITINSGSKRVTEVELLFVESEKDIPYIIDKYNKAQENWSDNQDYTITFTNDKVYKTLSNKQLFRLFDAVPLKAKALEVLNNFITFGNYTENYDIVDENGNEIEIDYTLNKVSTPILDEVCEPSLKSNRVIEGGLVYGDSYGRLTTILNSKENSVLIPTSDSVNKNTIEVTINHKPPAFAKFYRIFVKQNKDNYDTLMPTLFYEDSVYVWVKIEKGDIDKVSEGDFLISKSGTRGIISSYIETKVLEIKDQDKNFLEVNEEKDTLQFAGTYMKLKPSGALNIDIEDLSLYSYKSYDTDRGVNPVINDGDNYIQPVVFYGETKDDLTTSGTYTGNDDKRYIITIKTKGDGVTTFDTFDARDYEGNDIKIDEPITAGTPQLLNNGVSITFASDVGHEVNDKWCFMAKTKDSGVAQSWRKHAYGIFKSPEGNELKSGSRLTFTYDEYGTEKQYRVLPFVVSSYYKNIEEWYYEENIDAKFFSEGIDSNRIWFRQGVVTERLDYRTPSTQLDIKKDGTGVMCMIIETIGDDDNGVFDGSPHVKATLDVRSSDSNIVFETKPKTIDSDIYYESSVTHFIENGLHLGDTNQTNTTPAIIQLPTFNCFAWGNGVESIKIKDSFNANRVTIQTRPLAPIENYRQNKRIASLTYGRPYDQTLNYNGLNEFNLSRVNFKDMDDKYGEIQIIKAFNTDLDVWQEDKTHRVLQGKASLYNQDGSSNVGKSNLTYDTVVPYSGEYGISTSPESLVVFGNYRYWADEKRGVFVRKGQSGIEIISANGMVDWFRDYFRNNPNAKNLACYDPYYGQVTLGFKDNTITWDEKVKGFTSFHSFIPDWMLRLNNRIFSIKNGNLWLHNVEGIGYNNFYGVQYKSSVTTIFNDEHSQDKIFKTLVLESTNSWKALLKTNYTESHIKLNEFNQRESRWFAYVRKNENESDLNAVSQGLGAVQDIDGLDVTFIEVPNIVSVGDNLWQYRAENKELIGEITDIDNNKITVDSFTNAPLFDTFCFSKKDSRIEGSELRGYYMEITLEDNTSTKNELFAVGSEVVKSYL